MSSQFDAVVIGSGLGGLTCGAFLARAGLKVCVCEQHSKAGGYAHHFNRGQFQFECGIHSVPMGPGGLVRNVLSRLGCEQQVECISLPEMYRVQTPRETFVMPSREDDIKQALVQRFPHESASLGRLFTMAKEFHESYIGALLGDTENFELHPGADSVASLRGISYQDFLQRMISDESLRRILYSQWPYAGVSPDAGSAAFMFMTFVMHLFEGSHFCKGGFATLAEALASVIRDCGGEVRTSCRVTRLAGDAARLSHAVTDRGEDIPARIFVCNASPFEVWRRLFDPAVRSKLWEKRLGRVRPSVSAVIAYLGLRRPVDSLQKGTVVNWFSSTDYGAIYRRIIEGRIDEVQQLALLIPPVEAQSNTLTLLSLVSGAVEHNWAEEKQRYAARMAAIAEQLYPGLGDQIDLMESGSPSTFFRYTANTGGALFGFEHASGLYSEAKIPARIHLKNYYRTGHWGLSGGGVWNVMANGLRVSRFILKEM